MGNIIIKDGFREGIALGSGIEDCFPIDLSGISPSEGEDLRFRMVPDRLACGTDQGRPS